MCAFLLFLSCLISSGQDRLQELLDRYDYKTAIAIIDGLTANVRRSYESGEGRQ